MSERRGIVVLDGKFYAIASLEESDSYEIGTRFVSLSLIELVEYQMCEEDARFG